MSRHAPRSPSRNRGTSEQPTSGSSRGRRRTSSTNAGKERRNREAAPDRSPRTSGRPTTGKKRAARPQPAAPAPVTRTQVTAVAATMTYQQRPAGTLRDAHLHLGPTNSGKTHRALEALLEHGQGVFAAPLRMLAREVYERLDALAPGKVGLVTGEEKINTSAPIICATTEAAPLTGGTLVLDEVHWVTDSDRGWAWTRLLTSGQYRSIHVLGDVSAERVVSDLLADAGTLTVHRHQRLAPIAYRPPVTVADVPAGAAVVAFSRKAVLSLARMLHDAGRRPAVLYGALPPRTRATQVAKFTSGAADVLVCTDVIGHGINLPVTEVIFAETEKFDGDRRRHLRIWEAAQIAGRAGRYGHADGGGGVRVLANLAWGERDPQLIKTAVQAAAGTVPTDLRITAAPLRPLFDELGVTDPTLLPAVPRAWKQSLGTLCGDQPLQAAIPAGTSARISALSAKELLGPLGAETAWNLATIPVDDADLVVAAAHSLLGRNPGAIRDLLRQAQEAADGPLEPAENAARAARDIAAVLTALGPLDDVTAQEALAVEAAASETITRLLLEEIRSTALGRCRGCGRGCAPWFQQCDRCHQRNSWR